MANLVGQTLTHYRIIDLIGRGGMGSVYKAHDSRLLRHVAIKLLRPELMVDKNKRSRFIKEAQTASSLNHPNICTIHDINEDNNQHFIVMELVDGQTLKELLDKRGIIPESELIEIAIKICEALSAVHEKGISHRDIKPENIMLNKNGLVKVMDFGLAKLATEYAEHAVEEKGIENWRNDYVDNVAASNLSGLLGTVHYMSPEQAQGLDIDTRSDIFSLGIMLHELANGIKPFEGNTNLDILKKIIQDPIVPAIPLNSNTTKFQSILAKTLEKDAGKRYQTVEEFLVDLKQIDTDVPKVPSHKIEKNPTKKFLLYSLLVIAILTTLIFLFQSKHEADNNFPPMRTTRFTSYPGWESNSTLSPDGKKVAFSWNGPRQDNFDIYVKGTDDSNPIRLTTSSFRDFNPEWSVDGDYIAFTRNLADASNWEHEIFIIPSLGGEEQKIINYHPGPQSITISWSGDNKHIYFRQWSDQDSGLTISKVSIETKEIEIMTHLPEDVFADFSPRESPDGKYLGFKRMKLAGQYDLYIKDLESKVTQQVTDVDVSISGFFWTKNSRSIIFSANLDGTSGLWKTDLFGGKPEKVLSGINITNPDYSSTGNKLVYNEQTSASSIWKIDLQNPEREVLHISSSFRNNNPDISPDGKKILFSSNRTGTQNIWICESDGTNPTQLTFLKNQTRAGYASWSPSNNELFVHFGGSNIDLMKTSGGESIAITLGDNPAWALNGQGFYASTFIPDLKLHHFSRDGKMLKQITKDTGMHAKPYGDYIYYIKHYSLRDIWRVSLDGSIEEPVIQGFDIGLKSWDLVSAGIYFKRNNKGNPLICFYDFNTTKISIIKKISWGHGGIAVDPDGQYLLYSKNEPGKSDIILVENFIP